MRIRVLNKIIHGQFTLNNKNKHTTMKKYIAPSLKVVNVENEAILAGSIGISSHNVDGSAALGNRRCSNIFDEDDTEEWN